MSYDFLPLVKAPVWGGNYQSSIEHRPMQAECR
jgi:hypothetical protein